VQRIPYPSSPLLRQLFRLPILLWRLGLGRLVGRLFMVLTTTGRSSGQPRRVAIEYHEFRGRKYVMAAWPQSDWYRNIVHQPLVTVQTAGGAEPATARRIVDPGELNEAYDFVESNPVFRRWLRVLGVASDREEFIASGDRLHLLTFDPTDQETPLPQSGDLWWIWPIAACGCAGAAALAVWLR